MSKDFRGLMGRKKYPIKIVGGLILGGYIYRYTPRCYAPASQHLLLLDS